MKFELWLQQDAPQLLRDRLRDFLQDPRGELVRAALPDKWSPRDGPMVVVTESGPQPSETGTDQELVNVTVRARDLPTARKTLTTIDGFLTTPGLQFLGFSISRTRGTRPIFGPDSLVGGYFASRVYSVGTTRKVHKHGS